MESRVVPAATGSVSGFAFIDASGNGVKDFVDLDHDTVQDPSGDEDELVVKGAKLHLTGTSDAGVMVNAQTTTNQQGAFSFTVVPAGTYTLKADANAVISGTLGDGVTVVVETMSVTKDVPIDGIAATGDLLLNTSDDVSAFSDGSLADLPLPTAGTGQSTGINEAPMLRNGQPATTVTVVQDAASPTTVDLTGVFDDPNVVTSQVQIRTSEGNVNVDLLDDEAPQTVQNFYNYVNSGAYDDAIFHRLASGFVLQGGGFKYNAAIAANPTADPPITASPASITEIPTNPAVQNEFDGINRSNLAGTVAMAKLGSDPNSATNQFFFNLANNSSNLDDQNGGFTVFGRLVGPDDTEIVNNMSTTTGTSTIKKFDASNATGVAAAVRGALDDLPLDGYLNGVAKTQAEIDASGNSNNKTGSTFATDTTAANFLWIIGVDTVVRDEVLTYSIVSNDHPEFFSDPEHLIKDNRLTLTSLAANQSGTATIVVRATDKNGLATGTVDNPDAIFTVTVEAEPVFTSPAAVNVAENTTAVQTVVATDADMPAQTVTYSRVGGADQALFSITSGGVLTFNSPPDFETPADANDDNVYVVQIQANDGHGGTTTQTINVTVTAVSDNDPEFTTDDSVDVAENTTAVLTVNATDDDLPAQTVMYSLVGGEDQDKFNLNEETGELTFKSAPDREMPTDVGGDNVYVVEVQADDGNNGATLQTISVTVTAVNDNGPEFTSASSAEVISGTTAVLTVIATDADLPGQTVAYTLFGGADKDLFNINEETGELTFDVAPDFDNPTDADGNNIYLVEVQANDGNGGLNTQVITVTVVSVM